MSGGRDRLRVEKKDQEWAAQGPEESAVILYDTMWNGTRRMAEAIGDGLAAEGIPYQMFHMAVSDRNDVIAEVFKAKAIIIGSPTFNQGLLPSISPILEELKGLKFQNKVSAAFGAYGWSGEAVGLIEEILSRSKIPLVAESVRAKWQPKADDLARCRELGGKVGQVIKAPR